MRDRLSELVRQRALVSEHLAWLDREIANASPTPAELTRAATAPAPAVPPAPASAGIETSGATTHAAAIPAVAPANAGSPTLTATTPPVANTSAAGPSDVPTAASDEIIDQYRVSPATVQQDVRKGCLLYFAAAFVVLGIVVAILYFTIGTH